MSRSSFRILCIGETWLGSDARSAFSALRRLGQYVQVIDESHFFPTEWSTVPGRIARKILRPLMVRELAARVIDEMRRFHPDALFVFKGNYVVPPILESARRFGTRTINYYPDVSFYTHGGELPRTLPHYDHVFNAKTFGIADMKRIGVKSVSFLPPGFDPEVHRPMNLSEDDRSRLGCDVSFIGTWSPKKESILTQVRRALPDVSMRVWGNQWEKRSGNALDSAVMGTGITGDDYARAICASRICLGLLSEARTGASSGDLITARTFQIPACGGFMLHEKTEEVLHYFDEGTEVSLFRDVPELVRNISHFLNQDRDRESIAQRGRDRALKSGYSSDDRMRDVIEWIQASTVSEA